MRISKYNISAYKSFTENPAFNKFSGFKISSISSQSIYLKLIFAEIANEAGWIAWDKKRIDDALKYLNYALRFSSLPDIFINKIELLCEENQIVDAIACCKEAIKIAKKNYDPICISYLEEVLEDLKHDKRAPE